MDEVLQDKNRNNKYKTHCRDKACSATMKMEFFGEGLKDISSMRVFYATLVGLVVGGAISSFTEYYTGLGKKPILNIVQQSRGHAFQKLSWQYFE